MRSAFLAYLEAEVPAKRGPHGRDRDEQDQVGVLCREEDDHEVADTGDRQRHKGRINNRDQEKPDKAKRQNQVQHTIAMLAGCCEQRGWKRVRKQVCERRQTAGEDGLCGQKEGRHAAKMLHGHGC